MKQYFALGALGALLGLVAACATTETPATAGGVTIKMESGCTLVMVGDVSKQGANAAPNSSTNTPTNDVKPSTTIPLVP